MGRYICGWIAALTILLILSINSRAEEGCSLDMEISEDVFSVKGDFGIPITLSDIGCIVVMRDEMCALEQVSFDDSAMVKDYFTSEEAPATKAFFVINSGVKTPLNSSVIAFSSKENALKFVAENGKGEVVQYAVLLEMDSGI